MAKVCDGEARGSDLNRPRPVRYASLVWSLVAGAGLAAAISVLFPQIDWMCDLIAQVAVLWGVLCLGAGVLAVCRRRALTGAWLIACAAGCLIVPVRATEGRLGTRAWQATDVRAWSILVGNIGPQNPDPIGAVRALDAFDADVLVLLEPSAPIMRALRPGGELDEPGAVMVRQRPERGEHSWLVVRTKRESMSLEHVGASDQPGQLSVLIKRGDERLGLVAVHVQSPRSRERWREALTQLEQAGVAAEALATTGVPVIVAGDLNSTPSGLVSRRLKRLTGLVRASPAGFGAGTFPSWLPGVLRVGIDDVLAPAGAKVLSWSTVEIPGSDHRGVLVRVVFENVGIEPDGPNPKRTEP